MIERYQAIATRDGIPIWLEATTRHSMAIYANLGFETIEEIVLGKGKAASNGIEEKGGVGVKIWAMIWRPHS